MNAGYIIKRAYTLSTGLSYPGYKLTADENSDGLALLNEMTAGWRHQAYLPDDLNFADTATEYTYQTELQQFLIYELAALMAQEAGYPLSADIRAERNDIKKNVLASLAPVTVGEVDEMLQTRNRLNINTGQ